MYKNIWIRTYPRFNNEKPSSTIARGERLSSAEIRTTDEHEYGGEVAASWTPWNHSATTAVSGFWWNYNLHALIIICTITRSWCFLLALDTTIPSLDANSHFQCKAHVTFIHCKSLLSCFLAELCLRRGKKRCELLGTTALSFQTTRMVSVAVKSGHPCPISGASSQLVERTVLYL